MRHVAVDWSGAKHPSGKIWLAEAVHGRLVWLEAFSTRESVVQRIFEYRRSGEPVVVGLDFSFSFPEWYCRHLGAHAVTDVWREVAARGESWLDACAWPFWGRPGRRRPELPAHLRHTEACVGRCSKIRPRSTFQIGGAGAVGTGSLRGMPFLLELRAAGCAVWPFDAPGHLTIIEIYPRLLTGPVTKSRAQTRGAYLERIARSWTAQHRSDAQQSEDAFDAAVSALTMSARWEGLPSSDSLTPIAALEGQIWEPSADSSPGIDVR